MKINFENSWASHWGGGCEQDTVHKCECNIELDRKGSKCITSVIFFKIFTVNLFCMCGTSTKKPTFSQKHSPPPLQNQNLAAMGQHHAGAEPWSRGILIMGFYKFFQYHNFHIWGGGSEGHLTKRGGACAPGAVVTPLRMDRWKDGWARLVFLMHMQVVMGIMAIRKSALMAQDEKVVQYKPQCIPSSGGIESRVH